MKLLTELNADFKGVRNLVIDPKEGPVVAKKEGETYFDTGLKILLTWNGTKWVGGSSGSSVKRVVSIPSSASLTLDLDTTDVGFQKNIQVAGTLTINAPSGTPVSEQRIEILLKSTNIQTLAWDAVFQGSSDLSLPTASTGTDKYDRLGFSWNEDAGKWQLIAKVFGF
jgi:hypothetical protein